MKKMVLTLGNLSKKAKIAVTGGILLIIAATVLVVLTACGKVGEDSSNPKAEVQPTQISNEIDSSEEEKSTTSAVTTVRSTTKVSSDTANTTVAKETKVTTVPTSVKPAEKSTPATKKSEVTQKTTVQSPSTKAPETKPQDTQAPATKKTETTTTTTQFIVTTQPPATQKPTQDEPPEKIKNRLAKVAQRFGLKEYAYVYSETPIIGTYTYLGSLSGEVIDVKDGTFTMKNETGNSVGGLITEWHGWAIQ